MPRLTEFALRRLCKMKHLLFLVAVLISFPAFAQSGRNRGPSSEWQLEPGRDDSGTVTDCMLRRAYPEDRGLAFVMIGDGSIEFGMFDPNRAIPDDGPLPISISVDGAKPSDVPAVSAMGGKMVTMLFADGLRFLRILVRSQVFLVLTPAGPEQFDLKGFDRASMDLVKCAVALSGGDPRGN